MKSVNEILNRVKQTPKFKFIQKYSCYNKLLELMPPRFSKSISFFYIKNNILFGALSHPGYKMELNYNKDLIRDLLKDLSSFDIDCKEVFKDINEIKFFVSKFSSPAPVISSNSTPRYQELAKGEFEINIKNSKLKEIFERIREDIIKNCERD